MAVSQLLIQNAITNTNLLFGFRVSRLLYPLFISKSLQHGGITSGFCISRPLCLLSKAWRYLNCQFRMQLQTLISYSDFVFHAFYIRFLYLSLYSMAVSQLLIQNAITNTNLLFGFRVSRLLYPLFISKSLQHGGITSGFCIPRPLRLLSKAWRYLNC